MNLEIGTMGTAVAQLQNDLNFCAYEAGTVDGDFGSLTQTAGTGAASLPWFRTGRHLWRPIRCRLNGRNQIDSGSPDKERLPPRNRWGCWPRDPGSHHGFPKKEWADC